MKKNKTIKGILILGLGGLLLVGGCAFIKKIGRKIIPKPPSPIISLSLSGMQFDDIPVPGNFKHLSDESTVFVNANVRTAEIKYIATSFIHTDDVMGFYERHMPGHGWQKVFEKDAGWKHLLTFEKDDEQCKVLVDKTPAETKLIIKVSLK